jgi:hypothetical protein
MQRSPLTASEETEFWIRWKRGESVPAIGRPGSTGGGSSYVDPAATGVTHAQGVKS